MTENLDKANINSWLQQDLVHEGVNLDDAVNVSVKEEADEDHENDSLLRVEVHDIVDTHHAKRSYWRQQTAAAGWLSQKGPVQVHNAAEETSKGALDDDFNASLIQIDLSEKVNVDNVSWLKYSKFRRQLCYCLFCVQKGSFASMTGAPFSTANDASRLTIY